MIDAHGPPTSRFQSAAASGVAAGSRVRLAFELRVIAGDLAGRVDRDELTRDEEAEMADVIDEAVDAVMPRVLDALDDALTPRLESLPLHARLTLARARGRREFGLG